MFLRPSRIARRAACATPLLMNRLLNRLGLRRVDGPVEGPGTGRPAGLQDRLARLALAAWTLLVCHPAWADLPTVVVPDDVDNGDFLGLMRSSLRVGVNIIILALGALAFYKVAAGALTKWDEYRKGRIELADIKEYVIAGGLVLAVIVALLTAANTIL